MNLEIQSMIKKALFLLAISTVIFVYSCKNDDGVSCVMCNSPQTTAFEVCEQSDGTASVNGENTGTSYAVYIADLETAGANCGI